MIQPFELADNDGTGDSWIPGKWCCAGRCFTRPEETVWGRRASPGAAWPGRRRGRWKSRFLGVAMCLTAALALWLCQCSALRDSQHSLMGFVLLIRGFIMAIDHLHVPPVALQHVALLGRSNSGSKKSISFLVYRKTLHETTLPFSRANSISVISRELCPI